MKKILPAITTITSQEWQNKIKEVDELGLTEVALFPTCLDKEARKLLVSFLEKSGIKSIPFIHIRGDMDLDELDYFINNYQTKIFNLHTGREYPIKEYGEYKKIICIENTPKYPLDKKEVREFAGICLSISHLRDAELVDKNRFDNDQEVLMEMPILCNHISAVCKEKDKKGSFSRHYFKNLSEFDYLKKYPKNYFSDFIAIELENNLKEQLKAIDYIKHFLE